MINNSIKILLFFVLFFSACKKEKWIFDSPANDNLELPLLLNINGKNCALDIESKSFRFPIVQNSISNFTAFVTFQDYTSLKFNGILFENGVENKFGDIAINTAYELEFTTNDEKNEFTLYFTSIPTVQIVALDKIKNEPKSYARIIVNYAKTNLETVNNIIGIEHRGISALAHPKKSMGFKLLNSFDMNNEKSLAFFNKKQNIDWVLDAMYIDKAKTRNLTSLALWQNLNTDFKHIGTSCEFVEVFLNYESLGLYTFCEKLNETFLDINAESVLITGKQNLETTYFRKHPKTKSIGPYWAGWEQKFPNPDFGGHDWSTINALSDLVTQQSDINFITQIAQVIDFDNFIDYFLYVNILKGYDSVGKNWYLYKKDLNEPFKIIPWDLDSSWGRDFTASKVKPQGLVSNGIYDRLLALNPEMFREKLKTRWAVLKNNEMSPSTLIGLFDENFETLNQSNLIEIDNQIWGKNVDLTSERAYLNYWIPVNWNYIDEYINSL